MNEDKLQSARPHSNPGWDHVPLYRWWRTSIVGSVSHEQVVARIVEDSRWSPRYAFMTMMSAGIAILGLLLSSPAVVIGAMLISPLMSPILGFGFSLALFDFVEMRRSLTALAIGTLAAVAFTVVIVMASPLKATTTEILARTRPSLFDLLVALFAALAGTFAVIRGRGETIVGVAIATALMPPLAVVGYAIATWNMPVLAGSTALFVTNFVTIALTAMILARFYGFGHSLSHRQSWAQTVLLLAVFVAMAVPLAISLEQIARESLVTNQVRNTLSQRFGTNARVTQLEIDFDANPLLVRSVIIAPRAAPKSRDDLRAQLQKTLGRPVQLQLDQVLLTPGAGAIDAQRAELRQSSEASAAARAADRAVARIVSMAAGVDTERITLDHDQRRVMATAAVLPGASLETYQVLERRASAAAEGWNVALVPPLGPMPLVRFGNGSDSLDEAARRTVLLSAWAAGRWNIPALAVPGLPPSVDNTPSLAGRRGLAIAALLRERGVRSVPAPSAGPAFRLVAAVPEQK
ncbi:MAG: DUF389 domain-containing protein [Sphingobium sp.]|uniref:DUF389 domain-containing protein n=1 Tax=Sphingobium sp. TaxID=1912891 RepID=UPI0029BC2BB8|nr:DUF389 domain-containing protein [Sphingobium sp.]MDX3910140.1 DUF389 domain-containing protein [Sphingobium sp.]